VIRKVLICVLSTTALVSAGYGVYRAAHSPLFLVQVVEVADQPDNAPVDAQAINWLAAVPVGQVNLFELDLQSIERRILTNAWIREVRLQKHFPQTLSIAVTFREPRALVQATNGGLEYVDATGKIFGKVDLRLQPDYPMLTGFSNESNGRLLEALKILEGWENSSLSKLSQVSTLSWDSNRGYRATVTYRLQQPHPPLQQTWGRAMVDLGSELDELNDSQFARLSHVFTYLSTNSIAARQIWADAGKKIVVKTARGS
jgi:hypothetical protein